MRPKTKLSILGVVYLIGDLTLFSYAMLHWSDAVTIVLALL